MSSVMIESGPKKSSQCPRSMRLMSLEGEKAGSARSSSKRFEKVESSETGNDCNEVVWMKTDLNDLWVPATAAGILLEEYAASRSLLCYDSL